MSLEYEEVPMGYMTDDELMSFLLDIEENDLMQAPPDFTANLMRKLPVEEASVVTLVPSERRHLSKAEKAREYYKYCVKIGLSVAASIAILFMGPSFMKTDVKPHVDVVERSAVVREIPSKEDILKNDRFLSFIPDGEIFSSLKEQHIFTNSEVKR